MQCRGNKLLTAVTRILLLIPLLIAAAFLNVTHAQSATPTPAVKNHAGHGQAPVHHEQQKPCCDMQSCIGCTVPVVALTLPKRGDGIAFLDHPLLPAKSFVNHHMVPDPPPPRLQS
jgi:hypothetical protein